MRFLVDAQLPPALARWLASHGHQAEHVVDIGMRDANDTTIWQFALQQGGDAPVILWLRIGNTSRRTLLQWLAPLLPHIERMILEGEHLIEIRHSGES